MLIGVRAQLRNGHLLRYRQKARISQAEACRRAGVHQSYWSMLESMNFAKLANGPTAVEAIQRIGDLIGVEPDEFCPLELRDAALGIERTAYNDVAPAQLSRYMNRAVSLPMPVTIEDELLQEGVTEAIDKALETLTYREREVVKCRFGIGMARAHTYEEVGKIFKVTRERIRQVEAKAIRKLQESGRAKFLAPYCAAEL